MSAIDSQVAAFSEQGFLVMENVLDRGVVERINRVIDADRGRHDDWMHRGAGHSQHANILPRESGFDEALWPVEIVGLLRGIMGEGVCLEEFSVMVREPMEGDLPATGWHRDFQRDESRPMGLHAISVIYYLTDVGPGDHCFSIVPGTHDARRDATPEQAGGDGVDIVGGAGAAVVFHTACLHGAHFKAGSRERRTLHLYYGYADGARVSGFTEIPDRLSCREDPSLPAGYFTQKPMVEKG